MAFEFKTFLRKIDIFAKKTQLRLNKKKSHKTLFGGILTILITLSMLWASYNFGSELFQKQNPDVSMTQNLLPPNSQLNFQNFNLIQLNQTASSNGNTEVLIDSQFYQFSFGVYAQSEEYHQMLNQSYVNIQISNKKNYKSNGTIVKQDIKMKYDICKNIIDKYPQIEQQNNGEDHNLDFVIDEKQLYCLEPDQQYSLGFQREFPVSLKSNVEFVISTCQNNSNFSHICKSQDQIDEMLQNAIFIIFYQDNTYQMNQYNTPQVRFLNQQIISIQPNIIQKVVNMDFEIIYLATDKGIVQTDFNEEIKGINLVNTNINLQQIGTSQTAENVLIQLNIQSTPFQTKYYRRYIKFQLVLAQIGGLVKAFFYILVFCSKPVRDMLYYESLLNAIYNFESKSVNDKNPSISRKLKTQVLNTFKKTINSLHKGQWQSGLSISSPLFKPNIDFNSDSKHSINSIPEQSEQSQESVKHQSQKSNEQQLSKIKISEPDESSQSQSLQLNITSENATSIEAKIAELFSQEKNALSFSTIDFLQHLCQQKKQRKHDFVAQGLKQIDEKLDIVFIVKKLMEIDKLKHLLLDRNQLRLFEFLPKPYLKREQTTLNLDSDIDRTDQINDKAEYVKQQQFKFEEEDAEYERVSTLQRLGQMQNLPQKKTTSIYWNDFFQEKTILEKAAMAYYAYGKIKKKDNPTDLDVNLIEMLDENVQELFMVKQDKDVQEMLKTYIFMKSQISGTGESHDQVYGSLKSLRHQQQQKKLQADNDVDSFYNQHSQISDSIVQKKQNNSTENEMQCQSNVSIKTNYDTNDDDSNKQINLSQMIKQNKHLFQSGQIKSKFGSQAQTINKQGINNDLQLIPQSQQKQFQIQQQQQQQQQFQQSKQKSLTSQQGPKPNSQQQKLQLKELNQLYEQQSSQLNQQKSQSILKSPNQSLRQLSQKRLKSSDQKQKIQKKKSL